MTPTDSTDDGLATFMKVRSRLHGIAYKMLRSAAEAEDVVQDVWVRWQTTDRAMVRDATAFLATTTRRVAINVMQSARSRHEMTVGPWPSEPADACADAGTSAERCEALACAIRLLLERLTPIERAAYVLREAFDYGYRDIAKVLRLEVANARQVVTRARQHVANGRRLPGNPSDQRRVGEILIAAIHCGDAIAVSQLAMSLGHCHKGDIDHEAGHHWRHGTHRIKARGRAA